MTVRILTSGLLGVLADLLQTADHDSEAGVMGGVLLHTGRGHHGAEPGQVELLAGVSSDRRVAGHTYTWCTGQMSSPTWWSVRDARNTITVFKAARGKDKLNTHAVEIIRSGGEITIREDPNLIDEGISLSFGEGELDTFPAPSLYRLLDRELPETVVRDGVFVDAEPRTDLVGRNLVPFCRVAARRGELLQLYRSHQHVPLLVQVGDTYRGLLAPHRGVDQPGGDSWQRPDAELYPPDLDHPRWRRRPRPDQDEPAPVQLDLDVTPDDVDDPEGGES